MRFDRTTRPGDYAAVRLGGENYWDVGLSWGDEFRAMLLRHAPVRDLAGGARPSMC